MFCCDFNLWDGWNRKEYISNFQIVMHQEMDIDGNSHLLPSDTSSESDPSEEMSDAGSEPEERRRDPLRSTIHQHTLISMHLTNQVVEVIDTDIKNIEKMECLPLHQHGGIEESRCEASHCVDHRESKENNKILSSSSSAIFYL